MKGLFCNICCFATLSFSVSSVLAADKVVVVPLGGGSDILLNQKCPGASTMVGIDEKGNIICNSKTVFRSSKVYNGNLGGLSGADAKCQSLADAAGLSGTYKAWLSDSNDSPNTRFAKTIGPYVLVDGTVIAYGYADLTDERIRAAIRYDESGNGPYGGLSWTGTSPEGGPIGANTCANWTTSCNNLPICNAMTGRDVTDLSWTEYTSDSCSFENNLYCFEQ